jgi:hypothetical protein
VDKRRTEKVPVHTITSAAAPLGDDIARRSRRYLAQMTLRTLCFLGAVFTWGHVPTPISVSLLVGAVVLPYVAVVLANAGRERPEQADPYTEAVLQLGAAPTAAPTSTGSPLDERYGRSPFDQSAPGPRAPHGPGHPFDQTHSDRDRSQQARFDDAFYDRMPFDRAPFDQPPYEQAPYDGARADAPPFGGTRASSTGPRPGGDRTGPDGDSGNGPDRD